MGCVPRIEFGCSSQSLTLSWNLRAWNLCRLNTISHFQKLPYPLVASTRKHYKNSLLLKRFLVGVGTEESSLSEDLLDESLSRPLTSDELKSLLIDTERSKLVKKLSEANQQNRFLKRQEHEITNIKTELALMELEVQALVKLAEEIANLGIPQGSRKISGKYIQSHLLSRLDGSSHPLLVSSLFRRSSNPWNDILIFYFFLPLKLFKKR
ncbi:PROTEIN TARGETING TO STARCH (PTST) [Arabidopsis thaliana]|uniref:PROTEIN TARGETING TO STARCH (PTST) n=1 Tax=Arabidopsis thaliana TaxID=3702 RepID=A0A1R7T3C7_ARATH|nr:PROTEIN TARGETING TO STARCH (PTST) [Arabidopsis thaliana]ANM71124.1 PROTEIN TARGETING TO STARCH (PTST) [Arabidopsis thaliana]|eukprot:NP_001332675.1 PROTEIN TARGETING TO STARCH (PTST) [Arabidopsis thaliana]